MTDQPLPLYRCQHTEQHNIDGRSRARVALTRCGQVATHLVGLPGCSVRLCSDHAREIQSHKFELVG